MIFTLIFCSIVIYLIVLFLLRIMGKRQLGEMQPFELVITLIIADIATIPMTENTIPLLQGIVPLFTLAIIHFILCFLSRKSQKIRRFVNGQPIILIDTNGIDYNALKKVNMSFGDLIESLRNSGYFNLDEILYAILQTNGTLSVMPRAQNAPLTASDMKIDKPQATLPMIVYAEGVLYTDNAKIAQIDTNFLENELNKYDLTLKKVLLVTIDQEGTMYIQPKNGKFLSVESNYKGDGNW